MPRQPDLLPRASFKLSPDARRKGPRLWVRRLVIWRDVATDPIRDIALRPGLNIVWSPDGADQNGDRAEDLIGHGSGKTLFCRMLRYCLGEPRYASEQQRQRIAEEMPEGGVGAEIIMDGVLWSVVRPFAARRKHFAVQGCTVEEAIANADAGSGIEPFVEAASAVFFPTAASALVPKGRSLSDLWLIALAWLTRDQECRFQHVLDWRASETDSESPARGLTRAEQLDALRIFVTALDAEERSVRATISQLEETKRRQEGDRDYLARSVEDERMRLASALALADTAVLQGRMGLAPITTAARARVDDAASVKPEPGNEDIASARKLLDEAQKHLGFVLQRKAAIEAKLPVVEQLIASIKSEMPGLSVSEVDAEAPPCPVCEIPIDRALAEGCKLSHKLPNLQSIRDRRQKRRDELAAEEKNLSSLRRELTGFPSEIALAEQAVAQQTERLRKLEATRDSREFAWYAAKRLADDVERYASQIDRQESAVAALRSTETEIATARDRASAFRDKQATAIARLSEKFDGIIREILGQQAKGRVTLTGNGLELHVELGGDRITAAIESLKIIALDLAALALSIEDKALTPSFLLHDSPREADLGMSLYSRIFTLAKCIEGAAAEPLFQYIITTTTQPPAEFLSKPWLALRLQGSPADERLLRCDL